MLKKVAVQVKLDYPAESTLFTMRDEESASDLAVATTGMPVESV